MENIISLKEKLKKISLFLDSMETGKINKIEKDILLQKLRDFYLEISNIDVEKAQSNFIPEASSKVQVLKKEEPVKVDFTPPVQIKPEPEIIKEEIKLEPIVAVDNPIEESLQINDDSVSDDVLKTADPEFVTEINDEDLFEFEEPVQEIKVIAEPVNLIEESQKQVMQEAAKKPSVEQASLFSSGNSTGIKTLGEQLGQNKTSINEMLSQKSNSQDIGTILKPISDIKAAIGVGDRFLYIRELFAGNTELFDATISHLNVLASYDEAHSYLASRFSWDEKSNTVATFLNVVKRRYV